MTEYVLMFPADDEAAWRRGTDADHQVTFDTDAETAEQISGFFLVTCDDHDALVEAAQVLTRAHPVVEIRPVADD